jgi:hypothetical protein
MKLGSLVMTRGINDTIAENEAFAKFVTRCIRRFCAADWGELCQEDKEQNDLAYADPDRYGRILASYDYPNNSEFDIYIIREADLSATTLLFPHEY